MESNRKSDARCSSSNQQLLLELSSKIRLTVTEPSFDDLRLYQSNKAPLLKLVVQLVSYCICHNVLSLRLTEVSFF